MPKVQLVALKSFVYGGKRRHAGDKFETPGQTDALRLRTFKFAEPAPKFVPPPAPEPVVRQPYVRRDIVTVPFAAVETATEPSPPVIDIPAIMAEGDPELAVESDAKPKRAYRRRDLTAES